MKKFLKKFALGCLMLVTLTGCKWYNIKAAKMDKVKGTYQLTIFKANGEGEEAIDFVEQKGIKAYLVITGEAVGYYYYKDNNSLVAAPVPVYLTYEYDDEKTDEVRYVTYDLTLGTADEDQFGVHEKLGVHIGWNKNVQRNEQDKNGMTIMGHEFNGKTTLHVKYKKVNNRTSLEDLNNLIRK